MSVFDYIEGLEPINESLLEDFKREMTDVVIPEIVRVMAERERLANLNRLGLQHGKKTA